MKNWKFERTIKLTQTLTNTTDLNLGKAEDSLTIDSIDLHQKRFVSMNKG